VGNLFSLIARCRGCHADKNQLTSVLSMDPMPLAGMFCETPEEARAAPVFPLTWMHCAQCGLVQVRENVDDSFLFSKYNYSSSTVPGLVRHFVSYSEFLAQRYSPSCELRFLEIGCNDGVLLNRLPETWKLFGCDPSDVAAKAAATAKYSFLNKPFSFSTIDSARLHGSLDVISGSNCLAHISDLKEVFEAAWIALHPGGHLWIEVHDLHALLKGSQWDTIYHEHKVEWSEESLKNCLAPIGFTHKETIHIPMHGGALRIAFEKSSKPASPPSRKVAPAAGLTNLRIAYESRYETPAARALAKIVGDGKRIAAYGAAGRANAYLNQLPKLQFDYIVDESPLRMHKFIPRVGTPVLPPAMLAEKPVDACLVTAWNYRDDIIRKNPQHKGVWLTAFEDQSAR
jgi:SAM-dependent methyltransferase